MPNDLRLYSILTENCWKIEIKAFPHCAIPHENQSLPPFTRPMTAAIKPARKKFKATTFMKAGMKMHFVKMFEKINVAKILPLKRKSRIFITRAEIVCKPLILQWTYKLLNRNHLLAALTGTCFKKQLLWKIFFSEIYHKCENDRLYLKEVLSSNLSQSE